MTPPRNTAKKKVTLDDLSAADRARLLEEAGSSLAGDTTTSEETARRNSAIGSLMDERDHERFCKEGSRRFELSEARRPPNPKKGIPAAYVATVRCQECGGSVVFDDPDIVSESGIEARDKLLARVIAIEEDQAA